MPKIIDDLRETILLNAKQIMLRDGYDKLTIRAVAQSSGVASGTIYNYFHSKEMLEATIMLNDWMKAIDQMKEQTARASSLQNALECIYREIAAYSAFYADTWSAGKTPNVKKGSPSLYTRHLQLVSQLCEITVPLFEKAGVQKPELTARMVTETILREASSGNRVEFQELLELVGQWTEN